LTERFGYTPPLYFRRDVPRKALVQIQADGVFGWDFVYRAIRMWCAELTPTEVILTRIFLALENATGEEEAARKREELFWPRQSSFRRNGWHQKEYRRLRRSAVRRVEKLTVPILQSVGVSRKAWSFPREPNYWPIC